MMIQKKRDIETHHKKTKYRNLYKEVEPSDNEMHELMLAIQSQYEKDKLLSNNGHANFQDGEILTLQSQIEIQLNVYSKTLQKVIQKSE